VPTAGGGGPSRRIEPHRGGAQERGASSAGLYPASRAGLPPGRVGPAHAEEEGRNYGELIVMAEEDPDRRHFARLLKAFREARGLSRAEFGALAGYSESTIKSFETGQRTVYEYHARARVR
jgi:DNA-binding XRE family transcriptional regulator